MVSHSSKKSLKTEYLDIMKEAKKQPGLIEIMKVYGQYNQLVTQTQDYFGMLQTTEAYSNSTSSTP